MRLLFVHQNFPGQYLHLVKHYVAAGHQVVFLTRRPNADIAGVRKLVYRPAREPQAGVHHYVRNIEDAVLHGQAVARLALQLKQEGFVPDVMIGHNAWGETLYLKDIFADTPLLAYFEFYYASHGADIGFDPEYPSTLDSRLRVHTLNAVNLMGLQAADIGQTPTRWQWSRYPAELRQRIVVLHEGIDTTLLQADPTATLELDNGQRLTREDEVITYVARNLEPYRGFHTFMRALPALMNRRPRAQVVMVGGDEVSYGRHLPQGQTYRANLLAELSGELDLARIHFLGRIPYARYCRVLQVSRAHVYLTYPFVLSWSMLESMAIGCCVVASATPPVQEVLRDADNGLLFEFQDQAAMIRQIERALEGGAAIDAMRQKARTDMLEHYDLASCCLPRQVALVERLASGGAADLLSGVHA